MRIQSLLTALALTLAAGASLAQDKVVYHVDNAAAQGLKGLRNVRNHIETDPTARITVVTHAEGVDLLARRARRRPMAPSTHRWSRR